MVLQRNKELRIVSECSQQWKKEQNHYFDSVINSASTRKKCEKQSIVVQVAIIKEKNGEFSAKDVFNFLYFINNTSARRLAGFRFVGL